MHMRCSIWCCHEDNSMVVVTYHQGQLLFLWLLDCQRSKQLNLFDSLLSSLISCNDHLLQGHALKIALRLNWLVFHMKNWQNSKQPRRPFPVGSTKNKTLILKIRGFIYYVIIFWEGGVSQMMTKWWRYFFWGVSR